MFGFANTAGCDLLQLHYRQCLAMAALLLRFRLLRLRICRLCRRLVCLLDNLALVIFAIWRGLQLVTKMCRAALALAGC